MSFEADSRLIAAWIARREAYAEVARIRDLAFRVKADQTALPILEFAAATDEPAIVIVGGGEESERVYSPEFADFAIATRRGELANAREQLPELVAELNELLPNLPSAEERWRKSVDLYEVEEDKCVREILEERPSLWSYIETRLGGAQPDSPLEAHIWNDAAVALVAEEVLQSNRDLLPDDLDRYGLEELGRVSLAELRVHRAQLVTGKTERVTPSPDLGHRFDERSRYLAEFVADMRQAGDPEWSAGFKRASDAWHSAPGEVRAYAHLSLPDVSGEEVLQVGFPILTGELGPPPETAEHFGLWVDAASAWLIAKATLSPRQLTAARKLVGDSAAHPHYRKFAEAAAALLWRSAPAEELSAFSTAYDAPASSLAVDGIRAPSDLGREPIRQI